MGANATKTFLKEETEATGQSDKPLTYENEKEMHQMGTTQRQGKVIVHRIIQEGENDNSATRQYDFPADNSIIMAEPQQKAHYEEDNGEKTKILQHQVPTTHSDQNNNNQARNIVHRTDEQLGNRHEPKVIFHRIVQEEYRVESPQPIPAERSGRRIVKKSRSLDDDEESSDLQIQETSDNSSCGENDNPPLVNEAESETELLSALSTDEDEQGSNVVLLQTLPIDEDNDDVKKGSYLKPQENYKQRRAQKRVAIETHFLPQYLSPRYLDSITEENNSDINDARSESSNSVLSHSDYAKFDHELIDEYEAKAKKANAIFPKSNLDFSKKHKHGPLPKTATMPARIREETVPMMVEAKILEQVPISESCTTLSNKLTPEPEAAEVVYINSASSSVADLLDLDYEQPFSNEHIEVGLDTDVNQFFAISSKSKLAEEGVYGTKSDCDSQHERTPVSQLSTAENADIEQQQKATKAQLTKIKYEHIAKQCQSKDDSSSSSSSEPLVKTFCRDTASSLENVGDRQISSENEAFEILKISPNQNNLASRIASNTSTANHIAESGTASESSAQNFKMNDIRKILNNENNTPGYDATQNTLPHIAPPPPPVKGGNSGALTTDESFAGDHSNLDSSDGESTVCLNDDKRNNELAIKKLRILCTETLASMPYGEDILEELAHVAQNIGEVRATKSVQSSAYPAISSDYSKLTPTASIPAQANATKLKPLTISPSDHNAAPQKTNEHSTFAPSFNQTDYELDAEHKIIETAAMMKKLRKSLTPPPPIPPPPIPPKSADTKNKTQRQLQKLHANDSSTCFRSANEQLLSFAKEDESKHRLLEIIHDNSNGLSLNQNHTQPSAVTQSHKNNSKQATTLSESSEQGINVTKEEQERKEKTTIGADAGATKTKTFTALREHSDRRNVEVCESFSASQSQFEKNAASSSTATTAIPKTTKMQQQATDCDTSKKFSERSSTDMFNINDEFSKMFPTMDQTDIFDLSRKRFSNIETSTQFPFCTQNFNMQPKRYSTIETSSYETKKKVEDGRVVYDTSERRHELFKDDKDSMTVSFPEEENAKLIDNNKSVAEQAAALDVDEIMSALNINKAFASAAEAAASDGNRLSPTPRKNDAILTTTTHFHSKEFETKKEEQENSTRSINRQQEQQTQTQNQHVDSTDSTLHKNIASTYEEFRQRAKAAAEATTTMPTIPRIPATSTLTSNDDYQPKMPVHFDHDTLFKEFDDLSNQLNKELETSRTNREKRFKSASLFDLSRMQNESKMRFEELKKQRHDHMKELEREIERSQQSRQFRIPTCQQKSADPAVRKSVPRVYDIPIHIENGSSQFQQAPASAPTFAEHPPYEFPVNTESNFTAKTPAPQARPISFSNLNSQRAESMFDLPHRQRTESLGTYKQSHADDWTRYASDLGSSENIAKPFAREVEICYKRSRPNLIRAPRMTVSTNDLTTNNHSYDAYNAFNVRRTHAPMLNQVPQKTTPQYRSCQSMIERDPNPTYISTTSRRGASPAPPPAFLPSTLVTNKTCMSEDKSRQRRASLPREIHEQQLKYIASKEQELKTEFERLEHERQRLLEEMQNAPIFPPPRTPRETYNHAPKLPTLSEGEVFRQQMAEEWLSKVAEREERRLQKIIKISKVNEEPERVSHFQQPCPQADIGDEFLKRVRERRTKLAMPSDSDWESGAESHPVAVGGGHSSETEEVLPVKVIEGKSETDFRQLPKHLREFAKFSNSEREKLDGGHREVRQEEERSHEVNNDSISSAVKKTSVVKTYKVSRHPVGSNSNNQPFEAAQRRTSGDFKIENASEQEVYNVKHEYMSEPEAEHDRPKKMTQLERRQYDGIGPVTNDGMPIILRSEVKAPHQHEWYKRLYQTIHKQKNSDDYVIRFKCPRGRYQNYKSNGYVSEPEPNYKSDYSTTKYRTLDRRNLQSSSSSTTNLKHPGNFVQDSDSYGTMPHPIKSGQNTYKNQPGRIEDYTTGYSSVSEKEKKEWYDEVMDIFNGHLEQTKLSPHYTEGNLSRALTKESGYTSDSNIVYRKKEVPLRNPLSPVEQKEAYKSLQAGGEPPLFGFRKPAPEKQREYPNRYFESDVNIHYKTPIRYEYKDSLSEEELAIRQAEQMQRLYQEERRRKYLQELQDMSSRRHTDNFIPSQKSPIALNRYDDFQSDLAKRSPNAINSSKTVARALYNFIGQTARELSFKKGDIIYIRRKIDKNWLEGEHNAMIGLLPSSYVEIISPDYRKQPPQKPSEGHARAKFNFQAQSNIELSLNKGELVTLTRRVDENWFEGKIANHKGIFPVSYVEVLSDIGSEEYKPSKTVITSSSITDLRPSLDTLRANINSEFNVITQNGHQAPNGILRETKDLHKTDVLHVDTSTEPIAYRSLYRYRPQNSDELELLEGDIVHVLEKCDDGWFVGTSQRTGCFGTFPGNYVERA